MRMPITTIFLEDQTSSKLTMERLSWESNPIDGKETQTTPVLPRLLLLSILLKLKKIQTKILENMVTNMKPPIEPTYLETRLYWPIRMELQLWESNLTDGREIMIILDQLRLLHLSILLKLIQMLQLALSLKRLISNMMVSNNSRNHLTSQIKRILMTIRIGIILIRNQILELMDK